VNFDIFHTVCDGFKFDINNYLFDLLYGCEYHEFCYFDSLYFVSLNEIATILHTSYVFQDVAHTSVDFVKKLFKLCLLFVLT
jgi:hypothetical protein